MYPQQLKFSLELSFVMDAALELDLPFTAGPEGITVQVASPREAYDFGVASAAARDRQRKRLATKRKRAKTR
jgi:hypothetical protein